MARASVSRKVSAWSSETWRRDHALDAHRVELLEALQLARLGRRLERGEGRERHQLALRARDVDLRELVRRQALAALDLRDHLVAAALDAEAVDVVAAQHRREVAAGLAQVDALRAHLVAVEDDLGLRLVELQVGVREDEQAARERLPHELVGELAELLAARRSRRSRGRPGSRRRPAAGPASCGMTRTPGIFESGPAASIRSCSVVLLPLAPGLGDHARRSRRWGRDLEDAARSPGTSGRRRGPCVAKSLVWSSVELADACTMPKTTPWSSAGASSFCENM